MSKHTITFTTLPAWVFPDAPHRTALYEAIALAGLEGKTIRLDAATQKRLMGGVVFGKQAIVVSEDGTVNVTRKTAFGMDCESMDYQPAHIARAVAAGKRLAPGIGGGRYYWG